MRKPYTFGAAILLAFFCSPAVAQPFPTSQRWVRAPEIGPPIANSRDFDLAFGADQLPVLAVVDGVNATVNLRKWTGTAWTSLAGLTFPGGQTPSRVKMASDWTGDIVVGLLVSGSSIQIYRLRDNQLRQLGASLPAAQATGYSVAIDAVGPVVAWQSGGFVTVRRWNGVSWSQVGPNVNQSPNIFAEPQSPALAVTGDGKLVVAYTMVAGDAFAIAARAWSGTAWAPLGAGVPSPSSMVSLGGDNSAPLAAYRAGAPSRVNRWNGSTWDALGQPCRAAAQGIVFGAPSLTLVGNRPIVICGIHNNPNAVTGRRTLVARSWSRLAGWEPFGAGTINGTSNLPNDNGLAYVIRADRRGRPWVAWTAQDGVFVSTVVEGGLSPQ